MILLSAVLRQDFRTDETIRSELGVLRPLLRLHRVPLRLRPDDQGPAAKEAWWVHLPGAAFRGHYRDGHFPRN